MRRRISGFTLIELMVAIAIVALLGLAAAPMLSDYMTNSRLREGGNTLMAETMFAQNEAIKRNGDVRVALNGSTLQVFDRTPEALQVDAVNGVLLRSRALPEGVSFDAELNMDFTGQGTPTDFPNTTYTANVSMTGITCSSEHRCPSLRVDAGGAIRLCADKTNCS